MYLFNPILLVLSVVKGIVPIWPVVPVVKSVGSLIKIICIYDVVLIWPFCPEFIVVYLGLLWGPWERIKVGPIGVVYGSHWVEGH